MSGAKVRKSSLGQWSKRYECEMQCGGVHKIQVEMRGQLGSGARANEDLAGHLRHWYFTLRAMERFKQGSDRIRSAFEKGHAGALWASGKVPGWGLL